MRLSSVYLYEKIKEKYEILEKGNLSGSDGYLRPFLCCGINKQGKKSEGELYDNYISEIKDVLGNRKKVMEVKNRWLKDHPELKEKIRETIKDIKKDRQKKKIEKEKMKPVIARGIH